MCCNGLICLLGLLVVMLLLATTLSMGMNTQRGTILQIVYTLLGAHLSRASKNPKQKKQYEFARVQEAARKDIERAFGVLQSRFAIVHGPARFWDKKTLKNIMTCCVILHNMIEDERGMNLEFFYDNVDSRVKPARDPNRIRAFLQTYKEIENANTHFQLQEDLIEHHWQRAGQ